MTKNRDARLHALNLISKRDYSEYSLKTRLAQKGFSSVDINQVVDFLKVSNLLNDTRFAENLVYSLRIRGYGERMIKIKLKQKGIQGDLINSMVSGQNDDSGVDKYTVISDLIDKKLRQGKDFNKISGFLLRRGFLLSEFLPILKQKTEDQEN